MFQIVRSYLLPPLFLIFYQYTFAVDLRGDWVCTNPWRQIGVVLDFHDESRATFSNIWNDSSTVVSYRLSGDSLFIEKKNQSILFGIIEGKTSNGFTLNTLQAKTWTFVKLTPTQFQESREQLLGILKGTAWTFRTQQDSMRIDFMATHKDDNKSLLLESMTHYRFDEISTDKEMWDMRQHKGKVFLFFSNYMFGLSLRQIESISSTSIVLAHPFRIAKLDVFKLDKKEPLSHSERDKLVATISAKQLSAIATDTIYSHRGHFKKGKKLNAALDLDFLKKKIAFQFDKDNTYRIYIDNKSWQKGKWELTSDGEYLILDDARDERNWVNLKRIDGKMTLAKFQEFKITEEESKIYLSIFTVQ